MLILFQDYIHCLPQLDIPAVLTIHKNLPFSSQNHEEALYSFVG